MQIAITVAGIFFLLLTSQGAFANEVQRCDYAETYEEHVDHARHQRDLTKAGLAWLTQWLSLPGMPFADGVFRESFLAYAEGRGSRVNWPKELHAATKRKLLQAARRYRESERIAQKSLQFPGVAPLERVWLWQGRFHEKQVLLRALIPPEMKEVEELFWQEVHSQRRATSWENFFPEIAPEQRSRLMELGREVVAARDELRAESRDPSLQCRIYSVRLNRHLQLALIDLEKAAKR